MTKAITLFHILLMISFDGIVTKPGSRYAQYDALFVARCEASCWMMENKSLCIKSCLTSELKKPGSCPLKNSTISPFAAVCLNICQRDSQCPGFTKCCHHSCGVTCQQPDDLQYAVGVPEIPTQVKILEGRRKKIIYITWNPGKLGNYDEKAGTVIYLIEERHHPGRNFIESHLSEWVPCSRTIKFSQILKHLVKPGRWYQFRVAAVNSNGSKGYSESSPPFSMSLSPKPPKAPENVTVGPLWYLNGSLNAELRWSPPLSDLPLYKYKVFWSRRLHGVKALDSVLVHQQVIPRDQTHFMLHNIQPNSLYFLQVQALSQFDKERLKGDKSGLVLNTTNYTNLTDNSISVNPNAINRIEGLHMQKLYWFQGDLRARISWKGKKNMTRYTVTWWAGSCHARRSEKSSFRLAATTKTSHFDLYDLQFNCRYRVSVRENSPENLKTMQDTSVTFTTPSCKRFKKYNNQDLL